MIYSFLDKKNQIYASCNLICKTSYSISWDTEKIILAFDRKIYLIFYQKVREEIILIKKREVEKMKF